MPRWWRDLPVSKKLYTVVGLMTLLIASELFTLFFAMQTLSAVRAFVGGEGLWSKAQKDAVHSLHRYVFTSESKFYDRFNQELKIVDGDRAARLELAKPDFDWNVTASGLIEGGNSASDVPGLIHLIRRFHRNPYIAQALRIWATGDHIIDEIRATATSLRRHVESGNKPALQDDLRRIDVDNSRLTRMENRFSNILGAGSRWLERVLMIILIFAILTVEGTGLILTLLFGRTLNRSLQEMMTVAGQVGGGDFSKRIPVRSYDELGRLATAFNKMTADLQENIGLRAEAVEANRAKTMFLAAASHEIRTPLGVILGLIEVLKDGSLSAEDRARYLATMERTGKSLNQIISDILDISKVETGHLDIHEEPFSLPALIDDLKILLEPRAAQTHNRLVFLPAPSAPTHVTSDSVRLRQILMNLITNALKFTSGGEVRVHYGMDGKDLFFEIRDSGIGIPPDRQKELFRPFSASQNGTGLGLALSRQLADFLDGGLILKESQPGKGSTFRVWIRPKQISHEKIPQPLKDRRSDAERFATLDSRKVLLVEDSPDNQMLIQLFLNRFRIKLDFASNGKEGLELAEREKYDAILMDMQMPIMDGYTASARLRERGYDGPIVALTANAMKQDRDRCLRAGCSGYVSKPIESAELFRILSDQLRVAQA